MRLNADTQGGGPPEFDLQGHRGGANCRFLMLILMQISMQILMLLHKVEVHQNLTCRDIEGVLESAGQADHSNNAMIAVVVLRWSS